MNIFLMLWILLAVGLFPILLKIKTPYGRYTNTHWGPMISNQWGWILMELPALLSFVYFFLMGHRPSLVTWIFFLCWVGHYFYRSLVFPWRLHGKPMPIVILLSAALFNAINGYFNGNYLGQTFYPLSWLYDPRFLIGLCLFFYGLWINRTADKTLLRLKRRFHGYSIPEGGLYHWISCPNYFGEIVQWLGFMIMTWSLPALAFALWTMANLIPRALHNHQWYQEKFSNYPKNRKAIFPYLL